MRLDIHHLIDNITFLFLHKIINWYKLLSLTPVSMVEKFLRKWERVEDATTDIDLPIQISSHKSRINELHGRD